MLKFKYHYLTNILSYQKPFEELWYQVSETNQFAGNFGSKGFTLEPHNHWISFQIKEQSIKVFYKLPSLPENSLAIYEMTEEPITYYRKYLVKNEVIIFTFTEKEEVEKREGKWVNKGGTND